MKHTLLFIFLLFGNSLTEDQPIENLSQNSWNAKVLHDFIRGKGRGSVARLSLQDALSQPNLFEDEEQPLLDLNDPSIVNAGGIYSDTKPQIQQQQQQQPKSPKAFSQIIMPTSIIAPASYLATLKKNPITMKATRLSSNERPTPITVVRESQEPRNRERINVVESSENILQITNPTVKKVVRKKNAQVATIKKESEPSIESFKELAGLFQQFLNKKKSKSSQIDETSVQTVYKQTTPKQPQTTSAIGQWESMDPNDEVLDEDELMPMNKDAWEQKMKQLSEQLSQVLKQIKQTKDQGKPVQPLKEPGYGKDGPIVTVLRNGSAEQSADGSYIFLATITLVQDEGKNILIDTGLGTDINGRTKLLNKLNSMGLAPPNINIVITTHGHPDHIGGIHDFPDADHYQGWYQHRGTRFNLSELFESDRLQLTSHIHLIRTPGHSSDDIAVVVRQEKTMGTVTIAGDTFIRKEDIDYPMMWQPLSANETQQAESRRRLICSDTAWIIPGHGPPFRVNSSIKSRFKC